VLLRSILLAASLAAGSLFTASAATAASEGWATGNVNLRSCASTRCQRLTTIPNGARVWVFNCAGWCELEYRGIHGFASANYIAVGGWQQPPPVVRPPLPPAIYWNFGRPWWDDRHHSWYDGRRWWYNDRWHDRPRRRDGGGVYFEFGF
jgi:uncharacterized protein YraI